MKLREQIKAEVPYDSNHGFDHRNLQAHYHYILKKIRLFFEFLNELEFTNVGSKSWSLVKRTKLYRVSQLVKGCLSWSKGVSAGQRVSQLVKRVFQLVKGCLSWSKGVSAGQSVFQLVKGCLSWSNKIEQGERLV